MSASQQQQQPPDWSFQVTENLINRASASPFGHASSPPPPQPPPAAAQQQQQQQQDTNRTPPLISPLPSNAVVITPTDQDSSFQRYVEHEYGPALHNRLSDQSMNNNKGSTAAYSTVKSKPSSDNTTLRMDDVPSFWTALAKDGDATKKKQDQQEKGMLPYHYETWGYEYNATPPWWVSRFDEDGLLSAGALLFLFGFIFPPLWWIGSFWPRRPREHGGKMAERWQRLNRIMSIGFSILVVLAIIICVAVWKS